MMKKQNNLFFAERHLVCFKGHEQYKPEDVKPEEIDLKIDRLEKAETLPKRIPFDEAERSHFVKNEMTDIKSDKLNEFMLIYSGASSSPQMNKDFFIKVLGFKPDYLNKQKNLDAKLTILIKGFQKHLNEKFPKAKIKVDGKLGKKTLARMQEVAAIENDNTEIAKEEIIMNFGDVIDSIGNLNPKDISKFKTIGSSVERNLFMWTQILNLEEPQRLDKKTDKFVEDAKYTNNYIQNKFRLFQRYLSAKTGKKLTVDGKFGPKSMQVFKEFVDNKNKKAAEKEKKKAEENKRKGYEADGLY